MQTWKCKCCKQIKPESEFYDDFGMRRKKMSDCKECVRARSRARYHALPPEKKREVNAKADQRRRRQLRALRQTLQETS